jgi:predicted outer membrane repeat protein
MGGGLYLAGAFTYLTNCTVSLNRATGLGGGIAAVQGSLSVSLQNSIVAGNTSPYQGFGDIYEPYGPVTAICSLIGDSPYNIAGGGNILGSPSHVINAMLGPLQNNGGPTMTMALLAGSPAIGHADNALAPATDQRGVTRRDLPGELADIGAFEL